MRSRHGYGQHRMAIVRRMALNPLRHEANAKTGVAAKRKSAGRKQSYPLNVICNLDTIALSQAC